MDDKNTIKEWYDIPDLWKTAELMIDASELLKQIDSQRAKDLSDALARHREDVVDVWAKLHKVMKEQEGVGG